MKTRHRVARIFALLPLFLLLSLPDCALAHCDGMDGPVVQAARKAAGYFPDDSHAEGAHDH